MDTLVMSSCPMAVFISFWSQITLSGRVEALVTSGVWLISTVSLGMATHSDAWGEAATSLEESSALVEGGVPWAMHVGLIGVESPNAWLQVPSIPHDKSSWTLVVMMMWLSILGGCSMVKWEGEGGVEVLWGARTFGIWSPGVIWERSTSRNDDLWAGLPSISMPWMSDPDSEVCTSSKPLFSPLGYTTWSPHCKSLPTFSWQRCLHALLHGTPSTMVLKWPSLERGTCWASSLSHIKAKA